MTFGSLFSGIGGFDLGFERAGLECVWQCEKDPQARSVLRRHWPNVAMFDDVCEVRNAERVDVICGGFPCQDLSVAGKRKGLAGERSGLWFEFHRVLDELRPVWVVIENVPGLLSSSGGRDFAVILRGLEELGYLVAWRVLDSQYFGLAQRRDRVFIVGSLGDGRCAEILFEPESLCWDSAPRREKGKETSGTLGGSSGNRGWSSDLDTSGAFIPLGIGGGDLGYTLRSNGSRSGDKGDGGMNTSVVAYALQHAQIGRKDEAGPQGKGWQEDVSFTLDSRPTADVVARPLTADMQRLDAETETLLSSSGVRRLTPNECARLQGFPDDWNDFLSDSARYKQFGNAVSVPVAKWLGERLIAAEERACVERQYAV